MLIHDLVAAMESIAPVHLAEEWDNVGLLVGDAARPLAGPVLLTVDLTHAVLDEAIGMKAGAIIAYHPPIFRPLKKLSAGSVVLGVAEAGIAVYSPHTALDAAPGGVTDWLINQAVMEPGAPATGFARQALTSASAIDPDQSHKVVVFVPRDSVEKVRAALTAAGAGVIGNYELCSFTSEGKGSFRGNESSNPAIGTRGELESVDEVRLEMVCPEHAIPAAVAALRASHPYEEPAFDLYKLSPKPRIGCGAGRLVTLDRPMTAEQIACRLKSSLGSTVMLASPTSSPKPQPGLTRIAAVPGSGGSMLDAATAAGVECFITGEMKHHEVLSATDRGCSVILAGHTETERGYLPTLAARLNTINPAFRAAVSTSDRPPLRPV